MSNDTARPGLAGTLATNVLPAYLFPAATAFPSALLIGDERLATAALTTIPIPSAIAALAVTLWFRRLHERAPGSRPASVVGAAALGALGGLALVLAGCAVLIGNGWFDASLLRDAAPSGALGGGFTALFSTRARNRRHRARELAPQGALA